MFRYIPNIITKITLLNASLLTVMSFVLLSFIGGGLLMFTEKDRTFHEEKIITREVEIKVQDDGNPYTHEYSKREIHAFTEDVSYEGIKPVDAIFTATSALCVTGLTTNDFSQFTIEGQIIVLVLIQMGGLGIIVFTSIFALTVFRGLSEQIPLKQLLASVMDSKHHDVTDMLKYVIYYTVIFEGLATLIMGVYLQWFADPLLLEGLNPWWWALFHSISAFNNAGFALLNNNLVNFATDPLINTVIAILIILGGIGYPVLIAFYLWFRTRFKSLKNNKVIKELKNDVSGVATTVQIRVAAWGTLFLIIIGVILPILTEYNNPNFAQFTIPQKILFSFFQSVSTRTAGFNTVDIGALHISTLFLYIGLMFIGANPAGTAGGIKIPTVAVLYGYIKDWFRKPGLPVELFGRKISKFALSHAIRLFFFSVIFIMVVTFMISIFEKDYLLTPDSLINFQKVLFEVVSAFGTVGLSMGYQGGATSLSGIFSTGSKILIIVTMLFGRVGPLTILAALPWKWAHNNAPLSPDYKNSDKIQIG